MGEARSGKRRENLAWKAFAELVPSGSVVHQGQLRRSAQSPKFWSLVSKLINADVFFHRFVLAGFRTLLGRDAKREFFPRQLALLREKEFPLSDWQVDKAFAAVSRCYLTGIHRHLFPASHNDQRAVATCSEAPD